MTSFWSALFLSGLLFAQTPASTPMKTSPAVVVAPSKGAGPADSAAPPSGDAVITDGEAKPKSDEQVDAVSGELPIWNCRVDSTPATSGGFTVGEKFTLLCEGTRVELGQGEMHFQMPKELLYAIRILSVDKVSSNQVVMTVTTYIAGSMNLEGVVFVEDGVEKFAVKPFRLMSQSVIKEPRKEPFPARIGAKMGYPPWLQYVFGVVLLVLVFALLISLNRRAQRRGVLEKLKMHNSALGAYNQYNKDLRSLVRKNVISEHQPWGDEQSQNYFEQLDQLFRMFLLREFVVPATDWKSAAVISEIQKSDKKRFSAYGPLLKQYLNELDRAAKVAQVTMEDCQQLTLLGRKACQKIWLVRKTGRPA